jgi:hypothetical protein
MDSKFENQVFFVIYIYKITFITPVQCAIMISKVSTDCAEEAGCSADCGEEADE